ncbi:hypothetical protein Q3G72_025285 [Acer saccharum]|nr:hypothetical protein Q3G72_025285 [Acer saccharum]
MMDSNDDYIVDGEFQSRRRLEFEGRDNNLFPESNTIDENEVRDYEATVDITKKIEVIHGEIDDKLIPKVGYREKNKKDINVKIHRAETRFSCLAKMKIDCRQIGLIEDHRYEELTYDFKATQSSLKLSVNIEILKHASSIYTPAVFKMFQVELGKAYDCVLSICGDDGMLTKYKVTHHKRRFHHSVEFNSSNDTCILKRWTKYAKHVGREVVSKSSLNEDAKASMAKRYRDLCRLQTQVATKAAMREQTYEIAMNSLYKVIEDVEAHMRGMEVQDLDSSNIQGSTLPTSDGNVMDGKIKGVKTKGRPRGKFGRFKSALERATKKKKVVQKKSSLQV